MAVYLHGIKYELWNIIGNLEWLPNGEVPAEAVASLQAKQNELSLYLINDDLPTITRVAVAIESNRGVGGFSEFGYALLEPDVVHALGITVDDRPGVTHDRVANTWHHNLTHLTGTQLNEFSKVLWNHSGKNWITEKEVTELARHEISVGIIPLNMLNKAHKRQLGI